MWTWEYMYRSLGVISTGRGSSMSSLARQAMSNQKICGCHGGLCCAHDEDRWKYILCSLAHFIARLVFYLGSSRDAWGCGCMPRPCGLHPLPQFEFNRQNPTKQVLRTELPLNERAPVWARCWRLSSTRSLTDPRQSKHASAL